jgi:antitoxin component YwqK of YwqJK toxin-antitoxin module
MLNKILLTIVLVFTGINTFASLSDTIWNQTDKLGKKQGYWRGYYDKKNLKYSGFFKDNKPVGEMKRYYESGALKAIMNFSKDGINSKARFFYENGNLAGEGNYINSNKDSIWRYYSYYDKSLKLTETYKNGSKEGYTKRYYSKGTEAEAIFYRNNKSTGKWMQYFENGALKLQADLTNDIRTGEFSLFYPTGQIEQKGHFTNNLMTGDWIYYEQNGKEKMRITYVNGVAQNADKLNEQEKAFFDMIDKNKGKIPEPSEDNMKPY